MDEAACGGERRGRVGDDPGPLAEGRIGGDRDGAPLVSRAPTGSRSALVSAWSFVAQARSSRIGRWCSSSRSAAAPRASSRRATGGAGRGRWRARRARGRPFSIRPRPMAAARRLLPPPGGPSPATSAMTWALESVEGLGAGGRRASGSAGAARTRGGPFAGSLGAVAFARSPLSAPRRSAAGRSRSRAGAARRAGTGSVALVAAERGERDRQRSAAGARRCRAARPRGRARAPRRGTGGGRRGPRGRPSPGAGARRRSRASDGRAVPRRRRSRAPGRGCCASRPCRGGRRARRRARSDPSPPRGRDCGRARRVSRRSGGPSARRARGRSARCSRGAPPRLRSARLEGRPPAPRRSPRRARHGRARSRRRPGGSGGAGGRARCRRRSRRGRPRRRGPTARAGPARGAGGRRPPGADAALEGAAHAGAKVGVAARQLLEDRDRARDRPETGRETGRGLEQGHDLLLDEPLDRVGPAPAARRLPRRARARVALDPAARGRAEPGLGRGEGTVPAQRRVMRSLIRRSVTRRPGTGAPHDAQSIPPGGRPRSPGAPPARREPTRRGPDRVEPSHRDRRPALVEVVRFLGPRAPARAILPPPSASPR